MRIVLVLCFFVGCGSKADDRDAFVRAARAAVADAELSHPHPILSIRDLRASQAYFRDVLGFKIDWDHGDPADFGSVSRGDAGLFMCVGCPIPTGGWTMIFARDVDKLYEEYKAKDAIIVQQPTDMPWGLREMKVADLDGNILRFATGHD